MGQLEQVVERLQLVEGRLTEIEAQIDYKLGVLVREAGRAADAAEKTATRAIALHQQRINEDARHNAECIAKHVSVDQRINSLASAVPSVVISDDFDEVDTSVMSTQDLVEAKHARDRKIDRLNDQVVRLTAAAEAAEAIRKENLAAQAQMTKLRWGLYAAMGVAAITTIGTVVTAALQLLRP